jgi:phosphoribosyl-ATP pyrophosphohydrolase
MATIEDRRGNPPARSYTTSLFAAGSQAIAAKLVEEANEVCEAASVCDDQLGQAGQVGREQLIYESADLLYHLFVMLGYHRIGLAEVEAELGRRFGVSGLDEKAARQGKARPAP